MCTCTSFCQHSHWSIVRLSARSVFLLFRYTCASRTPVKEVVEEEEAEEESEEESEEEDEDAIMNA